jgi:drug/metabolite transporter (DMT)-like permease
MPLSKLSNNTKAILFTILTCFLVSVLIAIVRHLSAHFHVFFIIMMRNFFAFSLFIPLMVRSRSNLFKTQNLRWHILRNVNGMVAMMVWFYTVTLLPLPEAVSFTFIVPIITTLAAVFFLKEKVNARIWEALAIGFIGILIIIRPGFHGFKNAYIFALCTTILWSISNLIVKKMTKTDSPETIVGYMSFIMLILSIPLGLTKIVPLTFGDVFWLLMLGLFSNLSHLSMSTAYSKADLSLVQPFDFTRLIFTAIISYFAFNETADIWTWVGSLVILIGTIFVAPKNKKKYDEEILS